MNESVKVKSEKELRRGTKRLVKSLAPFVIAEDLALERMAFLRAVSVRIARSASLWEREAGLLSGESPTRDGVTSPGAVARARRYWEDSRREVDDVRAWVRSLGYSYRARRYWEDWDSELAAYPGYVYVYGMAILKPGAEGVSKGRFWTRWRAESYEEHEAESLEDAEEWLFTEAMETTELDDDDESILMTLLRDSYAGSKSPKESRLAVTVEEHERWRASRREVSCIATQATAGVIAAHWRADRYRSVPGYVYDFAMDDEVGGAIAVLSRGERQTDDCLTQWGGVQRFGTLRDTEEWLWNAICSSETEEG